MAFTCNTLQLFIQSLMVKPTHRLQCYFHVKPQKVFVDSTAFFSLETGFKLLFWCKTLPIPALDLITLSMLTTMQADLITACNVGYSTLAVK